MGMSNPRSASNAWALIKKKIKEFDAANKAADGSGAPAVATPGSGRKRKAAETVAAGADYEVATPTPSKRGRAKKATPTATGKATSGDAAMMPDTPTKNPKTPGVRGRGRPSKNATAAVAAAAETAAVTGEDDEVQELIKPEDVAELDSISIKKEGSASAEELDEVKDVKPEEQGKDGVDGDQEMEDAECI